MKKFLYNIRLIWRSDKTTVKELIGATILMAFFTITLTISVFIPFIFANTPIIFMWYKYYTVQSRLIAEVEHEIYLEKKYPFMHNRFTKEENQ